jgi:serine/threonine-protein kinase
MRRFLCAAILCLFAAFAYAGDAEDVFWESVVKGNVQEEYELYLKQYPKGRYVKEARRIVDVIREKARAQQEAKKQKQAQVEAAKRAMEEAKRKEEEESARRQAVQAAERQRAEAEAKRREEEEAQRRRAEAEAERERAEQEAMIPGRVFRDCYGCPEMVVVPSGSYDMGGSRRITLSRQFAVGKTEVTFAQWDACVAEGGCTHRPGDSGWGRGTQPVFGVNWDDAKQYVAWLARKTRKLYRLLTEAEWEYAARAGTTTRYYWGDNDSDGCQYGNITTGFFILSIGCGTNKTAPVGSKKPNAFGLYDMLGNVNEWVEECWNKDLDGIPSDGSASTTGDCDYRVYRGGSYYFGPILVGSAYRGVFRTSLGRYRDFGFRVARTL